MIAHRKIIPVMFDTISDILDLHRFPLHQPGSIAYVDLLDRCRTDLERDGMCNLEGLVLPEIAHQAAEAIKPVMATEAFVHSRRHNIYFEDAVEGLPADHPALRECETSNLTLCADQLTDSPIMLLYEWSMLHCFLAAVTGKAELFAMQDPLARVNVMSYPEGHTLNWHFDRSEFTTTLLLQAPDEGGAFEYRTGLRTADDPNHDGVAKLLLGEDPDVRKMSLSAGTLNVFRGINTPHRVTPVVGQTDRMVAVFSFYDRPGVSFTPEEQIGFYGRQA
jgi:hypothetical protein